MKLLRFLFMLAFGCCADAQITHGPVLGRPGTDTISIWVRTAKPGPVEVKYGTGRGNPMRQAKLDSTRLGHDNTGIVTLRGLQSDTRYYYVVDTLPPGKPRKGTFRTLPAGPDFANAEYNPDGLFNFRFEVGCCNNQRHGTELKMPMKTYETMNRLVADKIHFAILNGDWLYEEKREYTVPEWQKQTGTGDKRLPDILQFSPAVAGVWENYKLYWDRAPHLRQWHANVPSFFTADDHELVNDIYGCATPGFRNRRAVFRDPAMRARFDYPAWAIPV